MLMFDDAEKEKRDRKIRKRARLEHFGSPLLSEEIIDKMVSEPDIDMYLNMYIEPIRKPRVKDPENGVNFSRQEVREALRKIREEHGYDIY